MSNYWQDRQKELYSALEKDENDLKIRLASVYEDEYSRLDKEIAAYYQKYGENNVIKYRNLMQTLPKEDVKLLIEQMDDFAAKYPQYANLLPVRTSIYKLDRLEGLQYSVRMHQLNISAVNQQAISEHLNKQALRGANAAMETMGFGKNFYTVNSDIVKKFVDVPWCNGLSFSQRIWQDGDKLANYITTDIAQGFARGESYQKLTKQLCTRFEGVAKKDAYRLIYTEGTYVMAESTIQPFTEDFEDYRVSTAADGKVCSICSSIAKGTFKIKDRKPGINFPPFHPWCRCTFEIVEPADWDKWMDDYVKRHKSGGEKVLKNFNNTDLPIAMNNANYKTSNEMHDFGNGTGGSKKTAKATIYKTQEGTKFIFPEKYNKAHQQMTPEKAISLWDKVPKSIRKQAQKTIEFVDYYNPADTYWKKQYKNFSHSYATGGDKIVFWRYDYSHQDDYVIRTYCHEAAHFIDTNISTSGNRFSSEIIWTNAMKNDKIVSGLKSPTKYGENSSTEDFAESVAEFVNDEIGFTKKFPNRAKIISSILKRVI